MKCEELIVTIPYCLDIWLNRVVRVVASLGLCYRSFYLCLFMKKEPHFYGSSSGFGHTIVTLSCKYLLLLTFPRAHNPKVIGSTPIPATQEKPFYQRDIEGFLFN